MKMTIDNSKIIRPYYEGNTSPPSTKEYMPLTIFDKVNYNTQVAVIFAYRPPTPPNAALELGLRKALSVFRPFSGRLRQDKNDDPIILLNDEGVKFIEVSVDGSLDETISFEPSPKLKMLHPNTQGVDELLQVQVTRFTCGSMVVGFVSHHLVADGQGTSNFLVAWGQSTRGVPISPMPFLDRNNVFIPRDLPQFDQFEHRGVEYMSKKMDYTNLEKGILEDEIMVHKVRYSREFLDKIKRNASPHLNTLFL